MCSVALSKNGELVVLKETNKGMSHSTKLSLFVEQALQEAKITVKDLSAVAVSAGPGSYTGLRIGVSTAKGICFGSDLPLISVSTLQAIANAGAKQVESKEALICPMLDARRMEVYSAIYDVKNRVKSKDEAVVVENDSYQNLLEKTEVYFCGNGAPKTKEILTHHNAKFIDGVETSAENMVSISWNKFQNKEFEDLAYYEPFYLKSFVAGKPKKLL